MENYTPQQQQDVAEEMMSHAKTTAEDQFVIDYGVMRAKNREACGIK